MMSRWLTNISDNWLGTDSSHGTTEDGAINMHVATEFNVFQVGLLKLKIN